MNRKNLFQLLLSLLVFGITACENEVNKGFDPDEYEPIVAPDPVHTMNSMASGERVVLSSSAEDVVLSWTPTEKHGNTVYRYDVLLDTLGGDFLNPVYTLQADSNGLKPMLTVSHYQLNTIGRQAKFRCNTNGTLRWKVRAYCGLDDSMSSLEGYFVIFMMDGLDNLPATDSPVYITGQATEDNGVAENACRMYCESEYVYQAFVRLKAGLPFDFAADIDGERRFYYVDEDGKLNERLLSEEHTNMVGESGIYRVTVDFDGRTVTYDKINSVYLFCNAGSVHDDMTYLGYGKWGLKNYTARKHREGGADTGETRHTFRMEMTASDGSQQTIIWGHRNKDEQAAPGNDTDDEYYDLYISPSTDPWDYSFRYNSDLLQWGSEQDGWWTATVRTDVTLYFNTDFDAYTHRWTVAEGTSN